MDFKTRCEQGLISILHVTLQRLNQTVTVNVWGNHTLRDFRHLWADGLFSPLCLLLIQRDLCSKTQDYCLDTILTWIQISMSFYWNLFMAFLKVEMWKHAIGGEKKTTKKQFRPKPNSGKNSQQHLTAFFFFPQTTKYICYFHQIHTKHSLNYNL